MVSQLGSARLSNWSTTADSSAVPQYGHFVGNSACSHHPSSTLTSALFLASVASHRADGRTISCLVWLAWGLNGTGRKVIKVLAWMRSSSRYISASGQKGSHMPDLMVDFITSLDGYAAAEGWPGFWGMEGLSTCPGWGRHPSVSTPP